MAWTKLETTTLVAKATTVDVTIVSKKFITIMSHAIAITANLYPEIELNADTGSNYAYRRSINGGADGSGGSYKALFPTNTPVATTETFFSISHICDISGKERLGISQDVFSEASGATNAPSRQEHVSKWTNTADALTTVKRTEDGSGEYDTGSNVSIIGTD